MKKLLGILFISLFLYGCPPTGGLQSTGAWKYPWPQGLKKNQFIEKYFENKDLSEIEGIYMGSNNKYEIAVIKNTFGIFEGYDYLGILTDENATFWRVGEVKIVLKKSATPTILTGNYYMGDKSRMGRTFFFKQGYFEVSLPIGYYGAGVKSLFIKSYPEYSKTASSKKKATKKKSKPSSGSAFFVDNKGHIITNHHVVKECNNKSKIIYNNKEVEAKLIAKDDYLDLALLKADINNKDYILISNKSPRKLQRIIAAGYPFGKYLSDDMKFTSGIVSSLKGLGDDSTRLQIDAALNPGNSGGPIVDEQTGDLVAVAVAALNKDVIDNQAVNYGIKAASVKNFIESNQLDTKTLEKKYNTAGIAKLLENAVLYTFCP